MAKKPSKYQQALDFIYSFVDYSLTRQLRYSAEKFNLGRMFDLMELMGNPQRKYPVIHVAGTKGKGSTSAMIASILKASGYKVGLYTSPHLSDYCERIQVNGKPISHTGLVEQIEKIKPFLPKVPEITTFEITTAIGFDYFAEQNVDIAFIEVGLGGRLDATNIVEPLVSVITSLSYDHMEILGKTIELIAAEKAGIIKSGRPVIVSPQVYPAALQVVEEIALSRKSELVNVEKAYTYHAGKHTLDGQSFSVSIKNNASSIIEGDFYTTLLGFHQIENAVTALAVIDKIHQSGFKITKPQIITGLKSANWPCRFEIIKRKPLIILDSAHNPDSAAKLRKTIEDYLAGYKIALVFGASEDKDIRGMFEILLPIATEVYMTKSIHPRAAEPGMLVELARDFNVNAIETTSIEDALERATNVVSENTAIIVTGSIFVAAAARDEILKIKS